MLDPASAERLRSLATALKARPGLRIVVPGVWDDAADGTALRDATLLKRSTSAGDLEKLGQKRAESVRAALVASGLDASRVELKAPRAVASSTGGRVRLTLELAGATEAAEPSKAAETKS